MDTIFKLGIVVSVLDRLTGPVRTMARSVADLEKTMAAARAMVDFGQRMGLAGAVVSESAQKMRAVVAGILEPVARVEDAMASLRTVITPTMGSIEKSMKAARQAAIAWSKEHADSAETFLRTSYMMASAGLNDVQAIAGTRAALRLATATMGDSIEAANLLATVYNNVGDKTGDAEAELTRLSDVLAKTQQYFQFASLGTLTESLKYAIPAALGARVGFEELNTVIGMLNNAGLQGSMAGTAFAATMRQMIKASRELGFAIARTSDGGMDFIGTLENIVRKYGDLSRLTPQAQLKFQQAFGDEGLRAVMLLSGKLGDLRKALSDVRNSAGAAAEAQAVMEATASRQYEILRNDVAALKLELGAKLLPTLNQAAPVVRRLIDAISGFAAAHPQLAKTVVLAIALGAGVLTVVAPILAVTSGFITMLGYGLMGFAKLGQAVLWFRRLLISGRIGEMAAGIGRAFSVGLGWARQSALLLGRVLAALGARTAALGSRLLVLGRTAALQAASGLRSLALGMLAMARQAVAAAAAALPALIAKVWAFTAALWANPITWVVAGIMLLIGAIVLLVRHWDTVRRAAVAAWGAVRAAVAGAVQSAASILGSIRAAVAEALKKVLSYVMGLLGSFREAGAALWGAFVEGLKSVISGPLEVVRSGLARLRALLPFSDAKEGPLSTLSKSGAALVTTFAAGVQRKLPALREALAGSLERAWPRAPELAMPPLAAPELKVTVSAPAVDLSGLARAMQRGRDEVAERPVVIQGGLHVHVERVDDEESLLSMLRRFAAEVGAA